MKNYKTKIKSFKKGYAPTPFKRKGVSSRSERGYALLELLFYIALFTVLSLLVINSLILMTRVFRETMIYGELTQSSFIMERISREARQANSINTISVTSLKLNTKDEAEVDKTIEFILSGSNLQLLENDVFIGNLNTPNIIVADMSFSQIDTLEGSAVKVFLTIRSSNDAFARTFDFYDTIVLRGNY